MSDVKRYQRKPSFVEARIAETQETVQSANGPVTAEPGDYIILATQQNGQPDHYPVKPAEFLVRYDPA